MNGLTTVNIELTSRCNKACSMCGRRKLERDHPELATWGDMEWPLVESIAKQVPADIVIQFHWNGEPLLYPNFGKAVALFEKNIRCMDTNGKLLMEKADEIIGNLDTLTVSVVQDDPEGDEQYETVREFLLRKGTAPPMLIYRLLGRIKKAQRWYNLAGTVATRILHSPMGSYAYEKPVTVPEIGICQDLLTHLAIDRYGWVSPCVRFDPKGEHRIGNLNVYPLYDIWHGKIRRDYVELHKQGWRALLPFCSKCDYWGCPTS